MGKMKIKTLKPMVVSVVHKNKMQPEGFECEVDEKYGEIVVNRGAAKKIKAFSKSDKNQNVDVSEAVEKAVDAAKAEWDASHEAALNELKQANEQLESDKAALKGAADELANAKAELEKEKKAFEAEKKKATKK